MPVSLTPHQGATLAQNVTAVARDGIVTGQLELYHLGLGDPDQTKARDWYTVKRSPEFIRETVRAVKEDLYVSQLLLKGTVSQLPIKLRAPGREAIAQIKEATRELNHVLLTSNREKSFPHALEAMAAVRAAADAAQILAESTEL